MTKGRRALLLAHQYWPTPGSASQVLGALVRELVIHEFEVTVLTNANTRENRGRSSGPHGEVVMALTGPERSGVSLKRVWDLARYAVASLWWTRLQQYDVVISDAPPTAAWAGARIARRRPTPFLYYFSDSWGAASQGSGSVLGRLMNGVISAVEDRALAASNLTVAVTSEMAEIARAAGSHNIVEVHNGIDTMQARASSAEWRPRPEARPFFLYAGNAGVVHGAEVFVDAAEILWQQGYEFDLVFMGYGIGHSYALSAKERWPDRIQVLENQTTDVVSAAFRTATGALSSLRPIPAYAHARPMKSLTGAACGTPAVYAGEGDFADVIRENHLGFVSAWSPEGAAESMTRALELDASPNKEAFRQQVLDYAVSEFDERAGARTVVQHLLQILEGPAQARAHHEDLGDR